MHKDAAHSTGVTDQRGKEVGSKRYFFHLSNARMENVDSLR